MANITLTDANVNSGTAVTFFGDSRISIAYKKFVNAAQAGGKDTQSLSWNDCLAEADDRGFENTIITIEGSYNMSRFESYGTNEVRYSYLKAFVKSQEVKYLKDDEFADSTTYSSGMPEFSYSFSHLCCGR